MTDVQTAFSTESGRTYHLDRLIGKGGFGEVYAAGGTKLREIRRLAAKGQVVKVIGERQFWRLAESAARVRSAKRSKGKRAKVRSG